MLSSWEGILSGIHSGPQLWLTVHPPWAGHSVPQTHKSVKLKSFLPHLGLQGAEQHPLSDPSGLLPSQGLEAFDLGAAIPIPQKVLLREQEVHPVSAP